jgi:putative sterol carrier protein
MKLLNKKRKFRELSDMERFEGPTDIFGMAVHYSIASNMETSPDYQEFINNLDMNLKLELDYYPLMIKFQKDSFEVTREIEEPDIVMKIKTQDLLSLLDKKVGMLRLFFTRRLKLNFKGLLKILTVYKIFSKMVG